MPAMPQPVAGVAVPRARRVYLAVEYAVLFFAVTVAYYLVARGSSPIPVLVVLGAASVAYLFRQSTFDRAALWRPGVLPGHAWSILSLWLVAAIVAAAAVAIARPDLLLSLPSQRPLTWALIMMLYPLLSVYPQELVYRAFLCHRYAPVFGAGRGMVLASAAAFGFVHIIFGNWIAVVLSFAGGLIFASRYLRARSLLAASAEHALYGMLVFTVGLGEFFYHGAMSG